MIEVPALTFAAVRGSVPDALRSDQTTWLINVPAKVDGKVWNQVLADIVAPYVDRHRAICFEEVGKRDDRVFVLVGVRRRQA